MLLMPIRHIARLAAIAGLVAGAATARAAQLRVDPVLIELDAPAAAAVLTLRNDGDTEVVVQTRVVRWSQQNGVESLESTTDVVASPPSVKLVAHMDYVVRVVRVSSRPVVGEESYRVLVDQLPSVRRPQARAVEVLVRQSIPVFFRAPRSSPAQVSWRVSRAASQLVLTGSNAGAEHLRIASLRLHSNSGATASFGSGLAGYVLGGASRSWTIQAPPAGFVAGGLVSITADSDKGPVNATVTLENRP